MLTAMEATTTTGINLEMSDPLADSKRLQGLTRTGLPSIYVWTVPVKEGQPQGKAQNKA